MTIDLTKNTTAFGLMSEEEREALRALNDGQVEKYFGGSRPWGVTLGPFRETGIYRQRPTPPLIVDRDLWRHLPKEARWITADSDGEIWFYGEEPEPYLDARRWGQPRDRVRNSLCEQIRGNWLSITFTDPERWEEAIVKRPEGV